LLNAGFMKMLFFHDPVQQGDVEREYRDKSTGFGDHSLADGNMCLPAGAPELVIQHISSMMQVRFGRPQGTILLQRPGGFRTDIGVGHGSETVRQYTSPAQPVNP